MSKPVTLIELETPDGNPAVYFSMQEHTAREWSKIVARYSTETFPSGTCFVSATVIARLPNDGLANLFISSQKASYESVKVLVLNSDRPVKSRPNLELVEA